ncbi:MAG: cyclodeaminase/cyclohydrolase family protein [bacterium]|jgi:formiminotetrahydrofolate cyclodeaminase
MLIADDLQKYTSRLASREPVPGGGSASALVGALGIALGSMVGNLTVAKAEGENKAQLERLLIEAGQIQERLLQLVDLDAEAFQGVAQVFKLPKENDEQKAIRREAMQKALRGAAQIPMEVARLCYDALKLHKLFLGLGTPHAVSDIGVGVLFLGAALRGAGLNIQININSIHDQQFVAHVKKEIDPILEQGSCLAEEIYKEVEKKLNPEE